MLTEQQKGEQALLSSALWPRGGAPRCSLGCLCPVRGCAVSGFWRADLKVGLLRGMKKLWRVLGSTVSRSGQDRD